MQGTNKPQLRLDHLAVWVADMDATVRFLTDIVGWKRHPMVVEVSPEELTTGGMEAVFIDGNGLWLELILPTTPGPGLDILEEKGDGAIVEVNFEAVDDDYVNLLAEMESRGIQMLNMDGSPLRNAGRIEEGVRGNEASAESGQCIAYWPRDLSRGTTIEVYEKLSGDETNLLQIRDQHWHYGEFDSNTPRIDHVSIVVRDLEKSAAFYTDVMGLRRHPEKFIIEADDNEGIGGFEAAWIDANGVWLELVQPTTPGRLMSMLSEKGDGHPMEIIAEVDDIGRYVDTVKAKGITMVNIDGSPLDDTEKSYVQQTSGEKIAYFPQDMSRGMTIEIIQRGPSATSVLHRRDAVWNRSL